MSWRKRPDTIRKVKKSLQIPHNTTLATDIVERRNPSQSQGVKKPKRITTQDIKKE